MKYGIRMTGRKPNGQFYIDSVYILFDNAGAFRRLVKFFYSLVPTVTNPKGRS